MPKAKEAEMTETTRSNAWPGGIGAITLFVEDLEAARRFYQNVFGLDVVYEDENSAVFRFGETLINLLRAVRRRALSHPRPSRLSRLVYATSSRSESRTWMKCVTSCRCAVLSFSMGRWIALGGSEQPAS
jgi:catechol-2,3-dioxygenase